MPSGPSIAEVGLEEHRAAPPASSFPPATCVGCRELSTTAAADSKAAGFGKSCCAPAALGEGEEDEGSPSSSIGAAEKGSLSSLPWSSDDDDDDEEEEEEVQSKLKHGALGSMDLLEESLPVKRGLSNWFSGKSKSFACLAEAAALGSAKDMAKAENPFNKRRRILLNCKASWQRRASYAALNVSSLCALREDGDEEEDEDGGGGGASVTAHPFNRKLVGAFRSPRSFSLTDLHHAELA